MKFKHNNITETYEQRLCREQIIKSENQELCYVAPTSFGKSSLIIEIIKAKKPSRTSIIVPTKSLLIQTYKLIRHNFPRSNIIFHDEMYNGEESFISIFTQERALRLLKNRNLSFDLLIIDEAHNLFEMDSRSILLTRLLRRNRIRNPGSLNYYLSPLISQTENLKVNKEQHILEKRILKNIKEPDITEFRKNGEVFKYNRFVDEFYLLNKESTFTQYIVKNKKSKNFLYLMAPKKVEMFANLLNKELSETQSQKLSDLSQVISDNVHSDFYCVDYIKKGLVYLHGKLPDLIKEYLESKFSQIDEIKFLVANSVILEGVNLPIDNLFILNVHNLDAKSLTNLIGRVNRLNEVFDNKRKNLDKLLPTIHFVNSDEFNRVDGKMENKIKLLKNGTFKDTIKNPLLVNYDFDHISNDLKKETDDEKKSSLEDKIKALNEIKNREDFIVFNEGDEFNRVKITFMESGLSSIYDNPEAIFDSLEMRINEINQTREWLDADVIEKIYLFFIRGFESKIIDSKFLRLQHPKARTFYRLFTEKRHHLNLKEHISDMVKYFHSIKNSSTGREFYIGSSYGEISKKLPSDGFSQNVYIDLSEKSDKEIVNIALIKIKIESDFVSYTLNEYVNILFDLGLIDDSQYNIYVYGTDKKSNSEFVKIGLSGALINKLERDGQIKNISINKYGVIEHNKDFSYYIKKQDDLVQFEIGKYMNIY